ncbi:MAG: ketopantoate reductase family protein [Phycisphaerales bacterium]
MPSSAQLGAIPLNSAPSVEQFTHSESPTQAELRHPPNRAVIIGAGAVGAHLAASFRRGVKLLVVDSDARVRSAFGDRRVETAELGSSVSSCPFRPGDVAIIATSASRAAAAGAGVPPWVPMICVANGINAGLDADRSGGLTFGVVEFAASSVAPGHALRTRSGWLTLERGSVTAEWLAGALDPALQPARVVGDLHAHRRAKLMLNASLDTVAAVIGGTLGDVFRGRESFSAFRSLLSEALAVARASKWQLAPIQGLTPAGMQRVFGAPIVGAFAARVAAWQARSVQSTLAREIARGELGEADQLSGAIIHQGMAVRVPTPVHTRALEVLHRVARGGGGRPALVRELILNPGR